MKWSKSLGLLVCAGFGAASCGSPTRECAVGADCASGACLANGTCASVPTGDGPDGGRSDGGLTRDGSAPGQDTGTSSGDASVDTSAIPGSDGGGCQANDDDIVLRSQVFLEPGLHATFRIADNVTVDTTGTTLANGLRTWDFSGALSGDQDVVIQTSPVAGAWYASAFAAATYASLLSNADSLLGVYTANDTSLVLNGVVSESSSVSQTEVSYSPPATFLTFPLTDTSTWTSTSTVTGTLEGVDTVPYTEEYQSSVDAHGTLVVPFGTFHVLRVATTLTRDDVTVIRSFAFVTDCFGTIATVTSQSGTPIDPPAVEFTSAAEIERLAP